MERLVGPDWFRAAASAFAGAHPPSEPALVIYGEAFPDWLGAFPPAAAMPYLASAVLADRLWTEAHLAGDAEPLGPEALAGLGADDLIRTRASLHPSVRLAWFEGNAASLWRANRPPETPPEGFELTDGAEGLVIARPGGVVESRVIDAAAFAFIAACRDGASLAEAAAAALSADGACDLAAIVAAVFADGLIVALEPAGEGQP